MWTFIIVISVLIVGIFLFDTAKQSLSNAEEVLLNLVSTCNVASRNEVFGGELAETFQKFCS